MIERTEDWGYIRAIATHPRIWRRIAADGLDPADYTPTIHPRVHYLIEPDRVCGFFCWKPMTTVAYEAHIAVLAGDPERFARAACRWMLKHGARKLVALVPRHNWPAIALARKVGFKSECTLTRCVEWRGRLHDMAVLGLSDG